MSVRGAERSLIVRACSLMLERVTDAVTVTETRCELDVRIGQFVGCRAPAAGRHLPPAAAWAGRAALALLGALCVLLRPM